MKDSELTVTIVIPYAWWSWARATLLILVVASATSPPASPADRDCARERWKNCYEQMVSLVGEEELEEALEIADRLIADDQKDRASKRVHGTWTHEYWVHYYRARCLAGLGHYDAAETELASTAHPGKSELTFEIESSRRRLAEVQVARESELAKSDLQRAVDAESRFSRMLREEPVTTSLIEKDPALTKLRDDALERLQSARQQLLSGLQLSDLGGIETARNLAQQAREDFDRLGEQFDQRVAEVLLEEERIAQVLEPGEAVEKVHSTVAMGDGADQVENVASPPVKTRDADEQPIQAQEQVGSGDPSVNRASGSSPAAPAARSGPPEQLVLAARSYFSGNYASTVGLLEDADFEDDRARLQAHLFRAAATFALFKRGGESNLDLKHRAAEDVLVCRGINAEFDPDDEAFSPSFRAFFLGNSGKTESYQPTLPK